MRKKGIAVAGNMIVDMLYPIDGFPKPGELTTITALYRLPIKPRRETLLPFRGAVFMSPWRLAWRPPGGSGCAPAKCPDEEIFLKLSAPP